MSQPAPVTFDYWNGDESGPKRLRWGLDAHNRPCQGVRALLRTDSPAADLWEIAGSCFAVDRDVPRPGASRWREGPEWARRLRVRVPVRNVGFWKDTGHLAEELLNWMTGDAWTLEFTRQDSGFEPAQGSLFTTKGPVTALFSAGLDSTSGLAIELEKHAEKPFRLVTVVTNTRLSKRRQDIADGLRSLSGRTRGHGGLDSAAFHLNLQRKRPREDSSRTRGFVFLSAAVATAVAYESGTVQIYENGTGALNLACSRGQVGAQSARPVHPRTLMLMERLANEVSDHRIRIENPYSGSTKSELVASVSEKYDDILDKTVSCDSGFSRRAEGDPHCGICTSCLLRLQSIVSSGKGLRRSPRGRGPKSKRTHPKAMLWQVARLRHAFQDGPSWDRMVREFPDVLCAPGTLDPVRQREILGLFSRYVREWQNEELALALDGILSDE